LFELEYNIEEYCMKYLWLDIIQFWCRTIKF